MPERMYRAQILLEPRQRQQLEEIARREQRSVSAVTRLVIDAGLKSLETKSDIWERRARALSELRSIREYQTVEYSGNMIEEARQERENEVDRVWRNQS
jgi:predicted YcjX-like family ATPase